MHVGHPPSTTPHHIHSMSDVSPPRHHSHSTCGNIPLPCHYSNTTGFISRPRHHTHTISSVSPPCHQTHTIGSIPPPCHHAHTRKSSSLTSTWLPLHVISNSILIPPIDDDVLLLYQTQVISFIPSLVHLLSTSLYKTMLYSALTQ